MTVQKENISLSVTVTFDKRAIHRVALSYSPKFELILDPLERSSPLEGEILSYFSAYREKSSHLPKLPVNFSPLPEFTKLTLSAIGEIPFGEVASYGEIARQVGNPRASRAVGMVCHKNPFPLIIPCHRVISASGALGGFAFPLQVKEDLLAFEKKSTASYLTS